MTSTTTKKSAILNAIPIYPYSSQQTQTALQPSTASEPVSTKKKRTNRKKQTPKPRQQPKNSEEEIKNDVNKPMESMITSQKERFRVGIESILKDNRFFRLEKPRHDLFSKAFFLSVVLDKGPGMFLVRFKDFAEFTNPETWKHENLEENVVWHTTEEIIETRGGSSIEEGIGSDKYEQYLSYDRMKEYCIIFVIRTDTGVTSHFSIRPRTVYDDFSNDGFINRHVYRCQGCFPVFRPHYLDKGKVQTPSWFMGPETTPLPPQHITVCSSCKIFFMCNSSDSTHREIQADHAETCKDLRKNCEEMYKESEDDEERLSVQELHTRGMFSLFINRLTTLENIRAVNQTERKSLETRISTTKDAEQKHQLKEELKELVQDHEISEDENYMCTFEMMNRFMMEEFIVLQANAKSPLTREESAGLFAELLLSDELSSDMVNLRLVDKEKVVTTESSTSSSSSEEKKTIRKKPKKTNASKPKIRFSTVAKVRTIPSNEKPTEARIIVGKSSGTANVDSIRRGQNPISAKVLAGRPSMASEVSNSSPIVKASAVARNVNDIPVPARFSLTSKIVDSNNDDIDSSVKTKKKRKKNKTKSSSSSLSSLIAD